MAEIETTEFDHLAVDHKNIEIVDEGTVKNYIGVIRTFRDYLKLGNGKVLEENLIDSNIESFIRDESTQ